MILNRLGAVSHTKNMKRNYDLNFDQSLAFIVKNQSNIKTIYKLALHIQI
jgi:hypothetical protein